jgi:DNA-binding NarL/FixJ family response regulator
MRVLICHAHGLLLDALSVTLMQNGFTVVATALDPDEAVRAARAHQPDACLLHVSFLSTVARIHEVSAATKVVMLVGSIDKGLVADAIAPGTQGFVGKEKPVGSVFEALDMAFPGHLPMDPRMLQEILRPQDAEDRRDVGRPARRDVGRVDRRDEGQADRRDVGRADRRDVGRPDRRDEGRAARRDVGRPDG